MWPCSWGLALLCVPSPWPFLPYWKAIQSLLVEQMLYRAEHAWLVWQCKVTLSHQMLQTQLLSPLKFSMENQKPNSQIPRWSVNLRLINSLCVSMCVFCPVQEGKRRCKGEKKNTRWLVFPKCCIITAMQRHWKTLLLLNIVLSLQWASMWVEKLASVWDIWDFPSELSIKDPNTTKVLFSIQSLLPQFGNWPSVGVQVCMISGVKLSHQNHVSVHC